MTKLADRTDIPSLGDWVTLAEAAEILGYTRAYMYKKAAANGFATLHKIGDKASYIINRSEISELLTVREEKPVPVHEEVLTAAEELSMADILAQI